MIITGIDLRNVTIAMSVRDAAALAVLLKKLLDSQEPALFVAVAGKVDERYLLGPIGGDDVLTSVFSLISVGEQVANDVLEAKIELGLIPPEVEEEPEDGQVPVTKTTVN